MRENQRLIDDILTLGGNILGNVLGARHEAGAQARQKMDSLVRRLNLVSREEFDAAFAMLAKARAMQEDLQDRLSVIETEMNLSSGKKPKRAAKPSLPSVKKGNRRRKRA